MHTTLIVQNTFFTMTHEFKEDSRRRSSSAPPLGESHRPSSLALLPNGPDKDGLCSTNPGSTTCVESNVDSFESLSDVDRPALADASPSALEGTQSQRPRLQLRLSDSIEPPPQKTVAYKPLVVVTERFGTFGQVGVAQARPRLRSTATCFSPPATTEDSVPTEYFSQIRMVVAAVETSLLESNVVRNVEVSRTSSGFSIVVRLAPCHRGQPSPVLQIAKRVLLRACESSRNVYVLGYDAQPFAESPVGFAASLGIMEDEPTACWSSYSKGHCCRGRLCKWTHPTSRWTLNIMAPQW